MKYSKSQVEFLIEEYIHNKKHREMLKARLIDGDTYEEIAENFDYSVRQTKRIIYKAQDKLFSKIEP